MVYAIAMRKESGPARDPVVSVYLAVSRMEGDGVRLRVALRRDRNGPGESAAYGKSPPPTATSHPTSGYSNSTTRHTGRPRCLLAGPALLVTGFAQARCTMSFGNGSSSVTSESTATFLAGGRASGLSQTGAAEPFREPELPCAATSVT